MDSRRRLSVLALLSNLLLLWIIAASATPSTPAIASVRSSSEDKVTLALYYETLCPYCSNFIVNYLYKIFDDGLIDIVDLKLSPYGNAKIGPNNTITCQHGAYECLLNKIEACAIHVWPDVSEHFPYIYCVEKLVYEGKYTEWETCFTKLNLDPKPVTDCYSSGYGDTLELELAADTNALQPRHTYVPWVTVNGRPLYDDYYYFESRICRAYKGDNAPEVCDELSLSTSVLKIGDKRRFIADLSEIGTAAIRLVMIGGLLSPMELIGHLSPINRLLSAFIANRRFIRFLSSSPVSLFFPLPPAVAAATPPLFEAATRSSGMLGSGR